MSLQHQSHVKSYKVRIQTKHLRQYYHATDPITTDDDDDDDDDYDNDDDGDDKLFLWYD